MHALVENYFNIDVLGRYYPSILAGYVVTVEVALLTIALGVGVGLALAILRCLRLRALNALIVGVMLTV